MERRPVVAFDHHSESFAADPHAALAEVRNTCPVAWSEAHGGYWVATSYDAVREILRAPETYTSSPHDGYSTVSIPPNPSLIPFVPIETDGPEWRFWRKILNPILSPAAMENLGPTIDRWARHYVDRMLPRGQADLITDLASPVPAAITLDWLGLPIEHAQRMASISHDLVACAPDSPEYQAALEGHAWMYATVGGVLDERRAAPRDDILSYVVSRTHADGSALTETEALSVVTALIEAGVDTTTTLIGQALRYLGHRPEVRRVLVADPKALASATEEFLRYFSPVVGLGRRVAGTAGWHADLGMRIGDHVLVSYASANRDESQFDAPDTLDLMRFPNRHCAFGFGIHRCVGSHLARATFKGVLRTLLERIPDYEIDEAGVRSYPDAALLLGLAALPVTYSPVSTL